MKVEVGLERELLGEFLFFGGQNVEGHDRHRYNGNGRHEIGAQQPRDPKDDGVHREHRADFKQILVVMPIRIRKDNALDRCLPNPVQNGEFGAEIIEIKRQCRLGGVKQAQPLGDAWDPLREHGLVREDADRGAVENQRLRIEMEKHGRHLGP